MTGKENDYMSAHAGAQKGQKEEDRLISSADSGVAQYDAGSNRFAVKKVTEVQVGESYASDENLDANFAAPSIPEMPIEEQKRLFDSLQKALSVGKNTLSQNVVAQTVVIDDSWIDSIENGLFSIEQIVKKPATSIVEERDLVSVERAKRVDGVAVRHLSTHTEYIKDVLPDGSIRPSKIMTRALDQDVAIYENRFVYALVKRLNSFVEEKYATVKELSKIKDNTMLKAASEFKFGEADVTVNLGVTVKTPSGDKKTAEFNASALSRLETIRQHLKIIEGTEFARIMRAAKPVLPPVMKTNLLAGNVDYRKCYNLWVSMSSLDSVGDSVTVKEKSLPYDTDYFDDLTAVMADSVAVMMKNNSLRDALYSGIGFSTRRQKRFKVVKKVNFTVDKLNGKSTLDDDVNKYYVDKIKKAADGISDLSNAYDADKTLNVNVNFRRFYKGVQKINNGMFADLLKIGEKPDVSKKKTAVDKARATLAYQKEVVSKLKFINQLKADEIRLAELKLNTQEQRLKKAQEDLVKKQKAADEAKRIKAERALKEKEKKRIQKERAKAKAAKQRAKAQAAKTAKSKQNTSIAPIND